MANKLALSLTLAALVACLRAAPPRVRVELIAKPTILGQAPVFFSAAKPLPADNDSVALCIYPGEGYSLTDRWTLRTPEGGEARLAAHAELTDGSVTTLSSPSLTGECICYHPAGDGPLLAQVGRVRVVASQPIVAKSIVWSSTAP
jgi:hypothetical protein